MLVLNSTDMIALEKQEFSEFGQKLAVKFMERVGRAIAIHIDQYCKQNDGFVNSTVYVLAGKGNNAGDGYCAAQCLLVMGYRVIVWEVPGQQSLSPLCSQKKDNFLINGGRVELYNGQKELVESEPCILIDALFGTGFSGVLQGLYRDLVIAANSSGIPIFSIDIPSGINGNTGYTGTDQDSEQVCIHAARTYYLGFPKMGYFLGKAWNHVGVLQEILFGLSESAQMHAKASAFLLEAKWVKNQLPPIERQRHKYQAGLLHVWAGSKGMEGAAALVCRSALRTGCGLVKLAINQKDYQGFSILDLEVVRMLLEPGQGVFSRSNIGFLSEHFNQGDACVIGPGISLDIDVYAVLPELVPNLKIPLVLDADALTVYADKAFSLPEHTVMTPHIGELKRLLKVEKSFALNLDNLQVCQEYVDQHQVTLLVKGAPTFIFHPNTDVRIMPRGHPGMATAGTGDVLAGMIGAFLAQGLCVAAYLHGVSGELAGGELGTYSLMASDLIAKLPEAFAYLQRF
ncbi:MAG: NAD(P)H-hydrate dehydratase [Oligoflexales bacterium]